MQGVFSLIVLMIKPNTNENTYFMIPQKLLLEDIL